MQEVLHTLCDLDFQHEVELINLEREGSDESVKKFLRDTLNAAHWVKRQPYADLLNELRQRQYRNVVPGH